MKLIWAPQARQDRRDILRFIELDNVSAALRLDQTISEAADKLLHRPRLGRPGRISETREWVVHPNYILIYESTPDELQILRVLHTSRRWPPQD